MRRCQNPDSTSESMNNVCAVLDLSQKRVGLMSFINIQAWYLKVVCQKLRGGSAGARAFFPSNPNWVGIVTKKQNRNEQQQKMVECNQVTWPNQSWLPVSRNGSDLKSERNRCIFLLWVLLRWSKMENREKKHDDFLMHLSYCQSM